MTPREEYEQNGFCIVRDAIDANLAAEMVDHVHWLLEKNPDLSPEGLHHHLFVGDPFMHRLVRDKRLVDIAEHFLGPNVAMFAAHYIAKGPQKGKAVQWHQDGSYWPLEPMEVTTLWVAGSESVVANGCMRVIPGTQNDPLRSQDDMVDLNRDEFVLHKGIDPSEIDDSNAVDIELQPGDVSIHNPTIVHGSNANTSDSWRVGLTLRYIPTTTSVTNKQHASIMCRGDVVEDVGNLYTETPTWVDGEHMRFAGCEAWA